MTDDNVPGDTGVEFGDDDIETARSYLEENKIEYDSLNDDEIVTAAIDHLSKDADDDVDPVSPGTDKKEPEATKESSDPLAEVKAKLKEGDAQSVITLYEKLLAGREEDQQHIQAIGAAVESLITEQFVQTNKEAFPSLSSKKGVRAIQEKAGALLKTGTYDRVQDALDDAARILWGGSPENTTASGLAKLRALKSSGGPMKGNSKKAQQSFDSRAEWSDKIGMLVVQGRHKEAQALKDRGFKEK